MKKYILTDPSYLITDKNDWKKYCELLDSDWSKADDFLSKVLGTKTVSDSTTYGDSIYTNELVVEDDYYDEEHEDWRESYVLGEY